MEKHCAHTKINCERVKAKAKDSNLENQRFITCAFEILLADSNFPILMEDER